MALFAAGQAHAVSQGLWISAGELQRFDQLRGKGLFNEEHPFCMLVRGDYSKKLDGSIDELAGYHREGWQEGGEDDFGEATC